MQQDHLFMDPLSLSQTHRYRPKIFEYLFFWPSKTGGLVQLQYVCVCKTEIEHQVNRLEQVLYCSRPLHISCSDYRVLTMDCSLALFPGLPNVQFWLLAVCKNGWGRPGPFYHMNDISIYLGRQRGGGILKFLPKHWSFERSQSEKCTAPCSRLRTHNYVKYIILIRDSSTPSVCYGRHWCHSLDTWTRPSPSIIAYSKWSKTGLWEGLGTRKLQLHVSRKM